MKVTKALIAILMTIICGTGVFAQKSVSIIKPNPTYGGFDLQFKVVQVKGVTYALTYQYSAVQSFPIPFPLRTDSLKQDTLKTDSVFKYSFNQSNSNLSDPPSQFWLRIKMTDSTGTYYSDTVFVETWAIPKTPWVDTIQGAQNNSGTIETYLKYYSNVQGTLVTYGKFGNNSNIFNFPIDSMKNLISSDSNGLLNPKIPGIPSGSTFYVAYKLINAGGTSTINAMKVMPYVSGNQKPTLSKDSCTYVQSTKTIRTRIKSGFFGKNGSIKVYYGKTSGTYTDTLPSQYFNGIGLEYGVWELSNVTAGTTYFFKFVGTSSNGSTELLFSKTTDLDPTTTTLWVDSAYGSNLDINTKTMSVQVKGSFTLGSGITLGEIWGRLSDNPNFTLPMTSSSWLTTSTSGQTPLLSFNSNVGWDTTKIYYVQLVMLNKSTNELLYSNNYKIVYQPRPTPFSGSISGIQSDKGSGTAVINVSYVNTLQTTSTWKTSIGLKSDLSDGIMSAEAIGTNDYGNIKFPVSNLVSGVTYYVRATGINTIGKPFTTSITSFTLGTNTGIGEIQKPTLILYPNPVNDVFTISIPNKENYVFELFDMSGKLVLSKDIQDEALISRDGLPSGIYFYKVGTTTGKLVFN